MREKRNKSWKLWKEQLPISFRSCSRNIDNETLASFIRQSTQQKQRRKGRRRTTTTREEDPTKSEQASLELASKPKVDHKGVRKTTNYMFQKPSPQFICMEPIVKVDSWYLHMTHEHNSRYGAEKAGLQDLLLTCYNKNIVPIVTFQPSLCCRNSVSHLGYTFFCSSASFLLIVIMCFSLFKCGLNDLWFIGMNLNWVNVWFHLGN